MRILITILFLSLSAHLSHAAIAAPPFAIDEVIQASPPLSDDEKKDLDQGKIVLRPDEHLLGGLGMVFVKAPPEKVFGVVTDYAHYKEFIPATLSAEITAWEDNNIRVYSVYKSVWPFEDVTIDAWNVEDRANPNRLRSAWKAEKTNMKSSRGYWIVESYAGGTLVYHQNVFDMHWIPVAVARPAGKQRVIDTLAAVRTRAERVEPTASAR